MRNFELPGRSPAFATNGMVACSCVEASIAGLDVLRQGGNAMDAAIAADAVLGVVEPQQTGIGGDVFALYAPGNRSPVIAFDGSGRAPRRATPDALAAMGVTRIAAESAHAVTVPGAVDAWLQLTRDFGRMPMSELLAPAVRLANDGFAVSQRVAYDWEHQRQRLMHDAAATAAFLPGGKAPAPGDRFRKPALGATLDAIGARGREGFYGGVAARAMVAHLRAQGGVQTEEDFAATCGEYVKPIQTRVHDFDLLECPPGGQGFVPLLMLNILGGFDLAALPANGAQRLHLEIEAGRVAMALRDRLLADTATCRATVEELLLPAVAVRLRESIDAARAMTAPAHVVPLPTKQPASQNTVYLSVVDRDRNAVSFISSIYHFFGSGLFCPDAGVMFHSRGSGFSLDPAHANCIAPGKRPMHTIIPALLRKEERSVMPFGVMGGNYQPWGQVRVLLNMILYGMDVQEAIDGPRAVYNDGWVEIEQGFDADVAEALKSMGHQVRRTTLPLGGAQALWLDKKRGVLCGGSDPRKDGCAIGY
jgi:gamma-glutamyltranspeptidase/glutathione hydrolase